MSLLSSVFSNSKALPLFALVAGVMILGSQGAMLPLALGLAALLLFGAVAAAATRSPSAASALLPRLGV